MFYCESLRKCCCCVCARCLTDRLAWFQSVRLSAPDEIRQFSSRGVQVKEKERSGGSALVLWRKKSTRQLNIDTDRLRKVKAVRIGSCDGDSAVHVELVFYSLWCKHISVVVTLRRERQSRGKGLLPVCWRIEFVFSERRYG